jgi:hypothetical protein
MHIINQVENDMISYEQGSQAIKIEYDVLSEQSLQWVERGLSVLGGLGLIMAGAAMCTTGFGCIVGGYLGLHGANSIQEGVTGEDGFLKSAYKEMAEHIGMSESTGALAYDLIDVGISIKGKLKLVPKIDKTFKSSKVYPAAKAFKLFHYGRQDLTRAYKQMSKLFLMLEIVGDSLSLFKIYKETKNIMVKDDNSDNADLFIAHPEEITNTEEVIENCSLVIRITGSESDTDNQPNYWLCKRIDGTEYLKYYDGHIQEKE